MAFTGKQGYLVTIAGCALAFASPGVDISNLPTGDADWPTGITSSSIVPFGLDPNFGSWTESIDLIESTFNGGSLTIRLNDRKFSYDGAERNISTWLFSRNDQEETQLSATLDKSTSTGGTFAVQVPHTISGTNFVLWVENEAIYCSAISGNTVTVQTRGYYGTVVSNHEINTYSNYFPTVWKDFPGLANQEIKLWRQDQDGNWFIIWRGIANRSPRLNSNGTQFEIQCEHVWNKIAQQKFNVPDLSTTIFGVNGDTLRLRFYANDPATVTADYRRISSTNRFGQWERNKSVLNHTQNIINTSLREANLTRGCYPIIGENKLIVSSLYNGYGISVRGVIQGGPVMTTFVKPENEPQNVRETVFGFYQYKLELNDTNTYQIFPNGANVLIATKPFQLTSDVPSFTASGSVETCLTRPLFIAELEENTDYFTTSREGKLHFYPTSYNIGTSTEVGLYFLTGSAYFRAALPADSRVEVSPFVGIAEEKEMNLYYSLYARHWLDIFRHGIIEPKQNSLNWDFDNWSNLKSEAFNPAVESELIFEGGESYGDVFDTLGKFFGTAVTTTVDGKLKVIKISKPSNSSIVTDSITTKDLIGKPSWEMNQEGFITKIIVSSDYLANETLTINNRGAESRYGEGLTIEIDLKKIGSDYWLAENPIELTRFLNSRFLSMFDRPYDIVSFSTTLSKINTIFPGSIVSLTDWLIPNGTGTRGLTTVRALITDKTVDLVAGTIDFKAIRFADQQISRGFAPCVRINNIDVGSKTLTVATAYLSGSCSDYAGSNLAEYAETANDGGIGFFTSGDRCQLILRDSTTYSTFDVTLGSISSPTISVNETISTSPIDWPTEAAAGNVDLRFDSYTTSGIQSEQKEYAYIGDITDGLILSTDSVKRFS
jgi:hypothetical protein